MTEIRAGGVVFLEYEFSTRFQKQYKKLDSGLQNIVDSKLLDILKNPFPNGLAFEKLKGYADPDIYSFHVTGNYKISLESKDCAVELNGVATKGKKAYLRRVATHNEIDRAP